jgi:hypothetical protein
MLFQIDAHRLILLVSYYNGTTTIRIEPKEYIDDSNCDTEIGKNGPVEIVYEDSILGIVEESGYVEDPNPLAFHWLYWDKNLNITPPSTSGDGPINEIVAIDSVQ